MAGLSCHQTMMPNLFLHLQRDLTAFFGQGALDAALQLP
jgi:hypothetical protein